MHNSFLNIIKINRMDSFADGPSPTYLRPASLEGEEPSELRHFRELGLTSK
jgi:hypothetical protein